jgi:hypothetical protein
MGSGDRTDGFASPVHGWTSESSDIEEYLKIATSDLFEVEGTVVGNVTLSDERDTSERSSAAKRKRGSDQIEGTRRTRASKRKKKPAGLPKRPLSAYNIFFQRERLKLQQDESSNISFEEFGKIIGQRWKELSSEGSSEGRTEYNELAQVDSVRYRNEMDAYKAAGVKRKKHEDVDDDNDDDDKKKKNSAEEFSSPVRWVPMAPMGSLPESRGLPPTMTAAVQARFPSTHPNHPFPCFSGMNYPQQAHLAGAPDFANQRAYEGFPPSYAHRGLYGPPPMHPGTHPGCHAFPIPPGMEVVLPDSSGRERKYTVTYSLHSMSRGAAQQYMESMLPFPGVFPQPPGEYPKPQQAEHPAQELERRESLAQLPPPQQTPRQQQPVPPQHHYHGGVGPPSSR